MCDLTPSQQWIVIVKLQQFLFYDHKYISAIKLGDKLAALKGPNILYVYKKILTSIVYDF